MNVLIETHFGWSIMELKHAIGKEVVLVGTFNVGNKYHFRFLIMTWSFPWHDHFIFDAQLYYQWKCSVLPPLSPDWCKSSSQSEPRLHNCPANHSPVWHYVTCSKSPLSCFYRQLSTLLQTLTESQWSSSPGMALFRQAFSKVLQGQQVRHVNLQMTIPNPILSYHVTLTSAWHSFHHVESLPEYGTHALGAAMLQYGAQQFDILSIIMAS